MATCVVCATQVAEADAEIVETGLRCRPCSLRNEIATHVRNVAENEEDCLKQVRRFLSYLPTNVWELPPQAACGDPVDRCEDALAGIVPRSPRQPYDMRKLIAMVVDRDSVFEIHEDMERAVSSF